MLTKLNVGIAIAAVAAGMWLGYAINDRGWQKRENVRLQELVEQLKASQALHAAAQASVDTLSQQLESSRAAQRPKDRIITREVFRYVEVVPAADRVVLPARWRLLHDAGATGNPADAEPAGVVARAADPVEDAAAIETVVDNYESCRGYIEQVAGWQAWCDAVRCAR